MRIGGTSDYDLSVFAIWSEAFTAGSMRTGGNLRLRLSSGLNKIDTSTVHGSMRTGGNLRLRHSLSVAN